jgi:hypothetical protein
MKKVFQVYCRLPGAIGILSPQRYVAESVSQAVDYAIEDGFETRGADIAPDQSLTDIDDDMSFQG